MKMLKTCLGINCLQSFYKHILVSYDKDKHFVKKKSIKKFIQTIMDLAISRSVNHFLKI